MSERGTFSVDRGIWDHPLFRGEQFTRLDAWLWLLKEAAYMARRVDTLCGRSPTLVSLERGQLSHSLRFMARRWGWTVKRVRSFLARLETDSMITTQTGTGQTIITISNYDVYQFLPKDQGTQTGTQKGTQRARKGHKQEEGNKERKETGASSWSFEEWYPLYPKKVDPADARKALAQVEKRGDISFTQLKASTSRFAELERAEWAKGKDRKYTKAPAAWLRAGSYLNDDLAAAAFPIVEVRDPITFSAVDWQTIKRQHDRTGIWVAEHWGPAPGEPGCLLTEVDLLAGTERALHGRTLGQGQDNQSSLGTLGSD